MRTTFIILGLSLLVLASIDARDPALPPKGTGYFYQVPESSIEDINACNVTTRGNVTYYDSFGQKHPSDFCTDLVRFNKNPLIYKMSHFLKYFLLIG